MKRLTLKLVLLFYVLNATLGNANQPYGSTCSLEDGAVGFCADIAHCPSIAKLLRNQLITADQIKVCNKLSRYMCCPYSKSEDTTQESITSKSQTITNADDSTTTEGQIDLVKLSDIEYQNKNYTCGSSGISISLIVNGTQSERGAWPWLLTLHRFQNNFMFCGGTLISANAVVTAAHCMQDKGQKYPLTPNEFVVKLGRYDLSQFYERDAVDAYALDIFIHPNWKFFTREYDSDIAIIKLSAPVRFSTVISPVCLWKSNDPLSVSAGKIVGYGRSESNTVHEMIPRELDMKIISNEGCFLKDPKFAFISSSKTFCAGRDEYSAACRGDSGNGFFVNVNDRWYLRGIISASFIHMNNTCDTSSNTLFTNILKFSKWIEEKAPTIEKQFEEEPRVEPREELTSQDLVRHDKEIICSFTSLAVYRKKGGKFTVDSFNPKMCTTAIYHFAGLDQNFELQSLDPWLDLPDDNGLNGYKKFTDLKKSHPQLRMLLSVGGWNEGVKNYSNLASNETLRKNFAAQSATFLKEFGFDGLNFYWDFPGDTRRGGTAADKENLSHLLREISEVYRQQNLYLSATLRTKDWIVSSAYDIEEVSKHVDAIYMITFEYASSWDMKIGYPAALKSNLQGDNIDSAVNFFIDQKVPKNKMIIGIMLQAQTYTTDTNGLIGDDCEQEGFPGPIIQSSVLVGYNEICLMESQKEWTYEFDKVASQMIGRFKENGITHVAIYDTPRSVANKVKYTMEKDLLGVWAWSIDTDDFRGNCPIDTSTYTDFRGLRPKLTTKKDFPLLRTINDVIKFMNNKRN
ncbi:unnamed protein product [Chironomus riparius]|uniref:Uncharacterized protein n=1 Tax=Chironomus riparius TaxID=315576 RepID=A0A9N9RJ12_9DIPT|nr:unnamed protein product [Chironomus riparius]